MKHLLLILLALALVACGGTPDTPSVADEVAEREEAVELASDDAPTSEPEADPTAEPTEEPEPTATAVVEEETADVESDVSAPADKDEELPAASALPLNSPEEANITRPNDYYKGAEEPDVVLVEYGDFQ